MAYEYRNTPVGDIVPPGFCVLNDSESKTKKHAGYKFLVKIDSIDAFWGYGDNTSTVVVHGSYFHVEQSREEIAEIIKSKDEG